MGADVVIAVFLEAANNRKPASIVDVIGLPSQFCNATRIWNGGARDIIIEPIVKDFLWDDFEKTSELIAAGEAAARAALPDIRAALLQASGTSADSPPRAFRSNFRSELKRQERRKDGARSCVVNCFLASVLHAPSIRPDGFPLHSWPLPLPRLVSHAESASARRSGSTRKPASSWPSPVGSVSSNSVEPVKLRMAKPSSHSSGRAGVRRRQ